MEMENKENFGWREYEKDIFNSLKIKFPGCTFTYDDSVFGIFSQVDRQVDISIRGVIAGTKILGIIDCKYISKRVDVKEVESFLGMLEDINANLGILITNEGYTKAATRRAKVKNLELEVVTLEQLMEIDIEYDEIINKKIKSLRLSKFEFLNRAKENTHWFDENKSSYSKRLIVFKDGYVNTQYFAYKKSITESARAFRDFSELDRINIEMSAFRDSEDILGEREFRKYRCSVKRSELEDFLQLDFWELKQDIKLWREKFLENKDYQKQDVYDFAKSYITSKKVK